MSSKRLRADRCVIGLWRGYVKAQFYVRDDGSERLLLADVHDLARTVAKVDRDTQ